MVSDPTAAVGVGIGVLLLVVLGLGILTMPDRAWCRGYGLTYAALVAVLLVAYLAGGAR